jgi:hypothetical protein
MRALKMVLGEDTCEYTVSYVDDIVVFSRNLGEHMQHLDTILGRLTRAGFNINASKYKFCQKKISFLGHEISQTGVSADPQRTAAILNYPVPRNQKELRQFLGTCNFHRRFIVNYSQYVAPLLSLMKKGTKWHWTAELQEAFETLRWKFSNSISLVHPDENIPFCIYIDASKIAIGAIL